MLTWLNKSFTSLCFEWLSLSWLQAHDLLARDFKKLQEDHRILQEILSQRERLIDDHGLVVVHLNPESDQVSCSSASVQDDQDSGFSSSKDKRNTCRVQDDQDFGLSSSKDKRITSRVNGPTSTDYSATSPRPCSTDFNNKNHHHFSLFSGPTLISRDIILLLESFEGNNLEDKLKCMAEEREDLLREIQRLKINLEDERKLNEDKNQDKNQENNQENSSPRQQNSNNNTTPLDVSPDSDVKKMLHDYKFKLKRAQQDILVLQGNQSRLESQMSRYKSSAEELEKSNEDLKSEKRRILRELREHQTRCDELETEKSHLEKRIHKLKETRVANLISSAVGSGCTTPTNNGPSSSLLNNNSGSSAASSNYANNHFD